VVRRLEVPQRIYVAAMSAAIDAHVPQTLADGTAREYSTQIIAASWLGDRLRIVLETVIGFMVEAPRCGGAPSPPMPQLIHGFGVARTYEIAPDGSVISARDGEAAPIEQPVCDPRAP